MGRREGTDRPRGARDDAATAGREMAKAAIALSGELALAFRFEDGAMVAMSDALAERVGRARACGEVRAAELWVDRGEHEAMLHRLQAARELRAYPTRLRASTGEELTVSLSARLVHAGCEWLVVAKAPDTVERARVERDLRATALALEAANHELEVTLRSVGDGVITTDGWGRVLALNGVAERLTRWTNADARGRPLRDVFRVTRPGRGGAGSDPFSDVLNRRQDAASWPRAVLTARDGNEREIAESVSALRRSDGDGFGVLVVFRDVTAERRLEAELQKAQRLEALGVLGGGIAHDFNNLMAGILGNLGIVRQRAGEGELADRLAKAERAAVRARALTRQLLALARAPRPARAVVDVATLVGDASEFALCGGECRYTLHVEPGAERVEVDTDQMSRVVHNIVLNAREAMGDRGTIAISAARTEHTLRGESLGMPFVRLSVRDHGPGIPQGALERIFEPYFTTKREGSGLGLAVSQTIVAQHGGWIDVASTPEGTTLHVFLPAPGESAATEEEVRPPCNEAGGRRVLLVEDDDTIAEIAASMLEELGCTVTHVKRAEDAVAAYRRAQEVVRAGDLAHEYDLLLVDVHLRGSVDGRACVRTLRELGCRARAIVSSGHTDLDRSRVSGAFETVLAKPYTIDELRAAIDGAFSTPSLPPPPGPPNARRTSEP